MKHVVLYSGGYNSTLCAFLVAERYGTKDLVILNHYMPTEPSEVHAYHDKLSKALGVPITYGKNRLDQFDIALREGTFRSDKGFNCVKFMKIDDAEEVYKSFNDEFVLYFGFSPDEERRIHNQRTRGLYPSDFPLTWDIAKERSLEYYGFKFQLDCYNFMPHANCFGCLRGAYNHWYMTYSRVPFLYDKAARTERTIGESILPVFLDELVPFFDELRERGIPPTEFYPVGSFNKMVFEYFTPKGYEKLFVVY